MSNFSFSQNVFKRLVQQTYRNQGLPIHFFFFCLFRTLLESRSYLLPTQIYVLMVLQFTVSETGKEKSLYDDAVVVD